MRLRLTTAPVLTIIDGNQDLKFWTDEEANEKVH